MKFWPSRWALFVVLLFLGAAFLAYPPDFYANLENSKHTNLSKSAVEVGLAGAPAIAKTRPVPLDQMIGQMLMLGFSGKQEADEGARQARRLLAKGQIGGLIFMGANLENKAQVKRLVGSMKISTPLGLVPFLSIDQEGGTVQRLRGEHGFTDVPEASSFDGKISPTQARAIYGTLASELNEAGFNVNFGPVVDLNLIPDNPIIGGKGRSYGKRAEKVLDYARAFVLAHRQHNLLTSLKHFPGHGSSWTDSHEQFVDLTNSWKTSELVPYKNMVQSGLVDMVMIGHLYHPQFSDGDKMPASLSRKAIEGRLRKEIGYQGLVITDDLGMGAIKKNYKFEETIIQAIVAGNDILLLVDDKLATKEKINEIHMIIRTAITDKRISLARIQQSFNRIAGVKKKIKHQAAKNF